MCFGFGYSARTLRHMPRLTHTDYIAAHDYLYKIWKQDNATFALLSWSDQMVIHDYFAPTEKLAKEDLIAHRAIMTRASPSLPQRAGKVLMQYRRNMEEARLAQTPPATHLEPAMTHARSRARRAEHYCSISGKTYA